MYAANSIIEDEGFDLESQKRHQASLNLQHINFMNQLNAEFPQPYIVKPDYQEHKQQPSSPSRPQSSFQFSKKSRSFSQIQNLSNIMNQQKFMNQKESMRDKTIEYINNQDSRAYLDFQAQKQEEKQRQLTNQNNYNQIKQMLSNNNSFQTISSRPSTAINKTPSMSPTRNPTTKFESFKAGNSYENQSFQQNQTQNYSQNQSNDSINNLLSNIQKQKAHYIYKTAQVVNKQNNIMYIPQRAVPEVKHRNQLNIVSKSVQKQQFQENKRQNNMDKYEKQQLLKQQKERQRILSSLTYKTVAKEKLPIKIYDKLPLSCQKKVDAQPLGVNDLSPLRSKIKTSNKYPMVDQHIIQQIADLEQEEHHQYIKNIDKAKKYSNKLTYEKLQEQQRPHLQKTKNIYHQLNTGSAQQYQIVHFNELK